MKASSSNIEKYVSGLYERSKNSGKNDTTLKLIERIHTQYPGDIGNFAPLFLNHFTLQPGEFIFLGPNLPHAYLYGNFFFFYFIYLFLILFIFFFIYLFSIFFFILFIY